MVALALQLPEPLMEESKILAKKLKISRSQFIRMAIQDEVEKINRQFAEEEMLKAFQAMAKSPKYLAEAEELDQFGSTLTTALKQQEKPWWSKL